MRGKAQRVARRAQTSVQKSGVTGPMFTKFLKRQRWIIGGVDAPIAHKIGYHSNVPSAFAKRRLD